MLIFLGCNRSAIMPRSTSKEHLYMFYLYYMSYLYVNVYICSYVLYICIVGMYVYVLDLYIYIYIYICMYIRVFFIGSDNGKYMDANGQVLAKRRPLVGYTYTQRSV